MRREARRGMEIPSIGMPPNMTGRQGISRGGEEEPEAFHEGRWLLPRPLGGACLPGLAVAHCIVLTADGYFLLLRRGDARLPDADGLPW